MQPSAPLLDHLVYAAPNLETAVTEISAGLGVTPSEGGRHVGRGTRNFLLSLGEGRYLEIIGPDADQSSRPTSLPFGVDMIERPCLVAWAVRTSQIEERVIAACAAGYDPGPIREMSRQTPDGSLLRWKLTSTPTSRMPELIPFLIDWGESTHPSATAQGGARLIDFHAESPDPDSIQARLRALEVALPVERGHRPALSATIAGPAGNVTLTS